MTEIWEGKHKFPVACGVPAVVEYAAEISDLRLIMFFKAQLGGYKSHYGIVKYLIKMRKQNDLSRFLVLPLRTPKQDINIYGQPERIVYFGTRKG